MLHVQPPAAASATTDQVQAEVRALREDGTVDPAVTEPLPDDLALSVYGTMALARALDERAHGTLEGSGSEAMDGTPAWQEPGRVMAEGAALGAAVAMREQDWVFPSEHALGAALWRGMPPSLWTHASLAGWKAGRVVSVSRLPGRHIAHAVGVAWSARLRKQDVASLVFFGDGATAGGDFHTALNFAGVTRSPVIAVCVAGSPWAGRARTPSSASRSIAVKALAYGLRGVRVDGSDVMAVMSVVREARSRAASGKGGTLVEAVIPSGTESDPLARLRIHLEARGLLDQARLSQIAAEVERKVERAGAATSSGEVSAP
jgi:2-oxoisovalerate dehydrogenase E1 component alpha subunit